MPIVANDIVDLQDALATNKVHDQRFLNRVFTPSEQTSILNSKQPDNILWLFWAAKETGYKLISQLESPPVFSHKKFFVSHTNSELKVEYEQYLFTLDYEITQEYIHVYCKFKEVKQDQDQQQLHIKIDKLVEWNKEELLDYCKQNFTALERESIQSAASAAVRHDLKHYLSKKCALPYNSIEIIRNTLQGKSQPPYILINQKRSLINISFSHHGRYYAWVLLK